jgi:hypothetical protein
MVTSMNRRWVVLGLLGVAGCATRPARPGAGFTPPSRLPPPRLLTPHDAALAELEPLHLVWPTEEGLIVRVASRGCTLKTDWRFYLERRPGGAPARLAFGRAKVDACRSSGGQVDLLFTWGELGLPRGSEAILLNPLAR